MLAVDLVESRVNRFHNDDDEEGVDDDDNADDLIEDVDDRLQNRTSATLF